MADVRWLIDGDRLVGPWLDSWCAILVQWGMRYGAAKPETRNANRFAVRVAAIDTFSWDCHYSGSVLVGWLLETSLHSANAMTANAVPACVIKWRLSL